MNKQPEDILPIAKHFLMEFSKKFGKSFSGITPQAEQSLQQVHWRGNVHELKNIIERTTLIAKGPVLTIQDLGTQEVHSAHEQNPLPDTLTPAILPTGIDLPHS